MPVSMAVAVVITVAALTLPPFPFLLVCEPCCGNLIPVLVDKADVAVSVSITTRGT